MIAVLVAIVVAVAIAIVVIASMRKRRSTELAVSSSLLAASSDRAASWTIAEGDDFATLSEAARCDLIFAIQDLPGEERAATLCAALDDPSEIVAFAAATALTARGERARVEDYFAEHPGARSQRIRTDLSLLAG